MKGEARKHEHPLQLQQRQQRRRRHNSQQSLSGVAPVSLQAGANARLQRLGRPRVETSS
jgi:hypothetical protein